MTYPTRVICIAVLALAAITPASAAIRCDGSFQINSQGEFESPYCKEENLARIARQAGIAVTADQIRRSFSLEQDVCRQLGSNIEVANICGQFQRDHGHHCSPRFPC